ncbi:MAG: amino acid ABC transporter substrate-binding protein [Erysipelotrichaceae bacterium]|nr:amino acid ABC transporter substrate-binding protein [Erysipelotrichaceae bacterium]
MKKILKILLASVLTVGISGCSSSSDSDTSLLDEILEEGVITVAVEGTYSPYTYHDETTNDLVGYDVEIAEAVAEKLGVEVEFVETAWDGIIAGLDAKKYDVIFNQVGITEEREEKYLFSTPYTYSYGVIITKSDNNDINSFADLDGKSCAQTTTSNWATIVEENGGSIVATEGFSSSIQLVIQGRADATVNDNVTYYDYIKQQGDTDVKIVAQSDEPTKSAALIRQEDTELKEAIDEALLELKEEGTLSEISNKYFGFDVSVEA